MNNITNVLNGLLNRKKSIDFIKINQVITGLEEGDLFEIYKGLSDAALENMYENLNLIDLQNDSKEHFIYYFLYNKCEKNKDFFNQLIESYDKYKFLAIESLVVYLIKKEKLDNYQINLISNKFKVNVVQKELYKLNIRRSLDLEQYKLSLDEYRKLLEFDAYDVIENALKKNRVEIDVLKNILMPQNGERFKTKKMNLYNKAVYLLDNL